MGHMKRAEERERALRERLRSTHNIIIRWRREGTALLTDFLEPVSERRLSHRRRFHSTQTILDLVAKAVVPVERGPKFILLQRSLEAGEGQIEIEISGVDYLRLTTPRKSSS